ncbi:MAG TPA: NYN domain-containing protein [Candidatus Angelobacter sp.]|nr:NYN domain-containing protein [Candidatus Angelobacter sp.]
MAYVDGFNLYFGLKEAAWRRFLWLNLPKLADLLIDKTYQDLLLTKYFTTRISGPPGKKKRQSDYLEALDCHCQKSLVMFFGRYQDEPWTCARCEHTEQVSHEKKTDVNIAVEMITDAHANSFDTALLISADSDLVPAVAAVRRLFPEKRVVVAFPPERFSTELKGMAHASFTIGRAKFANAQLPETVIKRDGTALTRPDKWRPQATEFGNTLLEAIDKAAG